MISSFQSPILSINKACNTLEISKSGYYDWKSRNPASKDGKAALRAEIHGIALEFPKYGYRRITAELRRRNNLVNSKRVRRIMKEENLLVKRHKFKPKTTQSNHGLPKHPNLVKDIELTGINQAVVSDITYIHLLCEFVYLSVIMDLFSRRCVGWALSHSPDTQLTLDALNKAIDLRGTASLAGCIHHSDQGVQYAAVAYVQRLQEVGMRPSMGEKGNSYENAFAESFIKTLKVEEVYMNEYETMEDVYRNISQFIEEVYNKKRLHSSIGYVPPIEFEK